jgi:hypothetical protein
LHWNTSHDLANKNAKGSQRALGVRELLKMQEGAKKTHQDRYRCNVKM